MLTFNPELATKADAGNYINVGGVYIGKITKAECFSKESGAGGIEFAFESVDGSKVDYMQVYTKNRDGSENFAINKIHALMGLLGLGKAQTKQENGKTVISNFLNRNIGIRIRKEEYRKGDGSKGFKFEILNFLDSQTKKTYKEFVSNEEARTYLADVKDVLLHDNDSGFGQTQSYNHNNPLAPQPEEDFPF